MNFKISDEINSILTIVKTFIYVFFIFPLFGVLFIFITVITFILGIAGINVCEHIFEVCVSIFMYIIKHIPQSIWDILELFYEPIEPLLDEVGINFILIFIFVCILLYCFVSYLSILVLKKIKYLQRIGFISADKNELRLFMGVRIVTVKWDNIAEIKIVKQGQLNIVKNDNVIDDNNDKYCLCINFVSLDVFSHSLVNMLDLNKTNYGFNVVYSSNYFAKDINQIYSELINLHKNI